MSSSATASPSPSSSSDTHADSHETVGVFEAQELLKSHDESVDALIFQEQEALSKLKSDIAIDGKKNWIMQKEIADIEYKIRLLVLNLIKTDDMKQMLQANSFGRDKLSQQQQQQSSEKHSISEEAVKLYQNLFYLLRTKPRYLTELSTLVRGRDVDTLLQTTVFTIFGDQFDEHEENLLLQLFERMLYKEFQLCMDIGEFMRSNSVFTKMLNALLKRSTYHKFLLRVLSEPLEQVLLKSDLDLEINPSRIYREMVQDLDNRGVEHNYSPMLKESEAAELEPVKKILEPRIRQINEYAALFLKHIFESVRDTPYGIRYVCKRILKYGRERFRNSSKREIFSLVGGFVFLRFINPSIATCDAESVKLVSIKVTPKQRNNLKIICKLLQNLSNGVEFGSKETYTVPLNEFLVKYNGKMYDYFEQLCEVDEITERLEMNRFEELSQDTKTINISHNEIALVHRLLKDNMEKISAPEKFVSLREVELRQDLEERQNAQELDENAASGDTSNGNQKDDVSNDESNVSEGVEEEDRMVMIIRELDKLGPVPENLPSNQNYSIDLKLIDPRGEVDLDATEKGADSFEGLMIEATRLVSQILRRIPTLPSAEDSDESYNLEHVLVAAERHAQEKEDESFAANIAKALGILRQLSELREEGHPIPEPEIATERYAFLLQEVAQNAKQKTDRLAQLQKNRKHLEQVSTNVKTRHDYLASQLDLYKQFLQNALEKAFLSNGQEASSTIGPFVYKLSDLRKNGVIESTSLPKAVQGLVRVKFTSTEPGRFHVVASAAGVSITADLELANLLERQSKGETTFEVDERVTLNLEMLILWLNKLFVLGNEKKSKVTVIKKRKIAKRG